MLTGLSLVRVLVKSMLARHRADVNYLLDL